MHQPAPSRRRPTIGSLRRRILGLSLAVGTIGAALIVPSTAFAAASTTTLTDGTASTCTGGHWPASVQGMPSFHAGSTAGDRIWHDATGWHLRATHVGTTGFTFSGTIHANKPLHVHGYRLESGDTFTLSADKLTVTYRFKNYGAIDGLDFTTECATRLGFGAKMNGSLLPVRRIWLGHYGRHPLQNPFVILRRA